MEKSRLNQARTLAIRRKDYTEIEQIDKQLAVLNADLAERNRDKDENRRDDVLAKVNERNRKANMEAVRNAELREAERKRRERKLLAAGNSGTATPTFDPSARLKTVPKVFNSRLVSYSPFAYRVLPGLSLSLSLRECSCVDLTFASLLVPIPGNRRTAFNVQSWNAQYASTQSRRGCRYAKVNITSASSIWSWSRVWSIVFKSQEELRSLHVRFCGSGSRRLLISTAPYSGFISEAVSGCAIFF